MTLEEILKSKPGELQTPYADKFNEFQEALNKLNITCIMFTQAKHYHQNLDTYREDYHNEQVNVLKLYNDMLDLVQKAKLLD